MTTTSMTSLVVLSAIIIIIIINSCAAFTAHHNHHQLVGRSSATSTNRKMTMSMWGAQKLGQSVIGTTTVDTTSTSSSSSWFRRAPVGSGCDDTSDDNDDSEESEMKRYETMGKIDTSFKQHSLMMGLTSNTWGDQEKLQRIQAAAADGVISTMSLSSSSSARASDMSAGGLMKDWAFEL